MGARVMALVVAVAVSGFAGSRKVLTSHGGNETAELTATLLADKESVQEALGSDLGGHYILVDVKIASKYGKEISVQRDDFLLRTDRDGEKTKPFSPSQVAGPGALVISQTGSGGGAMMGDSGGPIWGGIPGTGGRPRRMGGDGGGIGNAGEAEGAAARVDSGASGKPNPLLKVLHSKVLPEKKTDQPVSGLLYFPMEKQKAKDLELIYTTPEGKISLRFR